MTSLAQCSWPEVGHGRLVLVPVGSLEQRGPHLPMDTDTVIATAVAAMAAAELAEATGRRVHVAPAVAYGASLGPRSTTVGASLSVDALRCVVVELVRSMRSWAGPVLLVNGHLGNLRSLDLAVEQLRAEGHLVDWVPCLVEPIEPEVHAATSVMLSLRPGEVRLPESNAIAASAADGVEILRGLVGAVVDACILSLPS